MRPVLKWCLLPLYVPLPALGNASVPALTYALMQALLKAGVSFAIIIKCLEIVCYETFDEWLSAAKK